MRTRPAQQRLLLAVFAAAGLFGAGLLLSRAAAAGGEPAPVVVGRPAPAFTLPDLENKNRSLFEFRGRRVALFFFCGCQWCAEVGKEWSQLQRTGALADKAATPDATKTKPPAAASDGPMTVIVYSEMSRDSAKSMAEWLAFDPAQTLVLLDEQMTVSTAQYKAEPCPRVFVVDEKGVLRYTNDHADDALRKAPAVAIVSRALAALRRAAPKKAPAKTARPQQPANPRQKTTSKS